MDKKIIIFDFDGTIADSMPLILNIFSEMSEGEGLGKFSDEQIEELRSLSMFQIIRKLKISKWKLPFFIRKGRRKFKEKLSAVKTIPGISEVLEELKRRGNTLGILSSNSLETVNSFVDNNSIHYFDFIYSENSLFGKAGILKNIIKKYNFDIKSIFYVGDEIRDIEAAKKAGVKMISVSWGMNSPKALLENKPEYLAENPDDILKIF